MMHARKDAGDTLVEVLLTIVILSLTITALVSGLATVANAGTAQRNSVQADVALRNYAESAKVAVQGCEPGATFTVEYDHPVGFDVSANTNQCPKSAAEPRQLILTVTGSSGLHAQMTIVVRMP